LEVVRQQSAEHERPAVALRVGHVAGGAGELREAGVGQRVRVDAEGIDLDPPHRTFAVIWEPVGIVRPHEERPALDLDHGPMVDPDGPDVFIPYG
jgi:hypothetical protein